MNNREKYIKASSMIEPSADFASRVLKEAEKMNTQETRTFKPIHFGAKRLMPIAASLILVFTLTVGAYAADIGGFKATVDSWLYGEATQIQVEQVGEYEYQITYPDGSVRGTGGAVDDGEGGMRAETPEEVIERINNEIAVEKNDEGRVILYFHDHVVDITDKIDENGIAKVDFKDGLLSTYITIKWNGDGSYVTNTGHFGYGSIE
jgi:hypothetical protein